MKKVEVKLTKFQLMLISHWSRKKAEEVNHYRDADWEEMHEHFSDISGVTGRASQGE